MESATTTVTVSNHRSQNLNQWIHEEKMMMEIKRIMVTMIKTMMLITGMMRMIMTIKIITMINIIMMKTSAMMRIMLNCE